MHFYCFERLRWWLALRAHDSKFEHTQESVTQCSLVCDFKAELFYVYKLCVLNGPRSRLFYTRQSCTPIFLHIQSWNIIRHSCCAHLHKPEHEGATNTAIQMYRIKFECVATVVYSASICLPPVQAVRLESAWSDRVRYMVVVYTSGRQDTEENILLGIDFTNKDWRGKHRGRVGLGCTCTV